MERLTAPLEFDLAKVPLTELNRFLHKELQDGDTRTVTVTNPDGAHNIAVGLDQPVKVDIHGHAGYYAAGMNKQANVTIHGSAGTGVAENMMSGTVHVKGFASNGAGATAHGGLLVIDGDAVRQAAEAGASEIELQDLTEDMGMTRAAVDPAERADFEAAWQAAGVTCIFQNAGEEGQDPLRLIKRLARFTYLTDMLPDLLRRAATPDDVVAAREDGQKKHDQGHDVLRISGSFSLGIVSYIIGTERGSPPDVSGNFSRVLA